MNWNSFFDGAITGGGIVFAAVVLAMAFSKRETKKLREKFERRLKEKEEETNEGH